MGLSSERAARLERSVGALVEAGPWLLVAAWIGVSAGAFAWALEVEEQTVSALVLANRASGEGQRGLLSRVLAGLCFTAALYATLTWRDAARTGRWSSRVPRRLGRALAFVIGLPWIVALGLPRFPALHPNVAALMTLGVGALAGVSAFTLARPGPEWRAPRSLGIGLVIALAIAWAVWIAGLGIAQHRAFFTGAYDLGIFVNTMWRSVSGDPLGCAFLPGESHLSSHFDPVLVPLGLTLFVHRAAETLIVLQAAWLAAGAVPVYLLGARRAGRGFGLVLAVSYLAHPALHGAALFDFHSLSLMVPPALFAIWALEERRFGIYAVSIALLTICREDMPIVAICIGLYGLVSGAPPDGRALRAAVATIFASIAYLAIVKLAIMPDPGLFMRPSETANAYASYFEGVIPEGGGVLDLARTLVTNPAYTLSRVLDPRRVPFLLTLLVPLALLPLAAGRRLVLLGYAAALLLLASRPAVTTIGFHYAAVALPGLYALAAEATPRLLDRASRALELDRARLGPALGAAIVASSLVAGSAFGALGDSERFVAGFHPLHGPLDAAERARHASFLALTRAIPPDVPVAATGRLIPHLAARETILFLDGAARAEWVVADLVAADGLERALVEGMRRDTRRWRRHAERDGFVILRRRARSRFRT